MIGGKDYSQQLGLTLKTRVQPQLQVPRLLLAPLRAGLRGVLPGCFKFQQSPVFKNKDRSPHMFDDLMVWLREKSSDFREIREVITQKYIFLLVEKNNWV